MRLVDADVIKQKYRDKFIKSLVDKDRGIDLSEYAEEPSKSFNRFIDEIPTITVLEQIRAEIENLNCEYIDYNTGCSAYVSQNDVLQIINNHTKGDN